MFDVFQVDGDKGIEQIFQEVVNYVDGALFIPQGSVDSLCLTYVLMSNFQKTQAENLWNKNVFPTVVILRM